MTTELTASEEHGLLLSDEQLPSDVHHIKEENEGETARTLDPLAENTDNEKPSDEESCKSSDNVDPTKSDSSPQPEPNPYSNPTARPRKRPLSPLPNNRSAQANRRTRKRRRRHYDSDSDDSRTAFLDLERRKLESAERLSEAVRGIRKEMKRIVHVVSEIRDSILVGIVTR